MLEINLGYSDGSRCLNTSKMVFSFRDFIIFLAWNCSSWCWIWSLVWESKRVKFKSNYGLTSIDDGILSVFTEWVIVFSVGILWFILEWGVEISHLFELCAWGILGSHGVVVFEWDEFLGFAVGVFSDVVDLGLTVVLFDVQLSHRRFPSLLIKQHIHFLRKRLRIWLIITLPQLYQLLNILLLLILGNPYLQTITFSFILLLLLLLLLLLFFLFEVRVVLLVLEGLE